MVQFYGIVFLIWGKFYTHGVGEECIQVLIGNPEDKIRNCLHVESVDVRVLLK